MSRVACCERATHETVISVKVDLDGEGIAKVDTGVGFFDHMLNLFSFHSGIDLEVNCTGDLFIDDHHTVEDVGIALGRSVKEALGNKESIKRYGTFYIPMDEALALVSIDISGRSALVFNGAFKRESIGNFSTEMVEEFFRAFSNHSGTTVHCNVLYGNNDHHKIEALFKAFGRALREAQTIDKERDGVQSSKGVL